MHTYISLLRGINVSGQKKILMSDLKRLYEDLKFKNVRTYIQSGNVVFQYKKEDAQKLSTTIQQKIFQQYNFDVAIFNITPEDLKEIIINNPFLNQKNIDQERVYVSFLSGVPEQEKIDKLMPFDFAPDSFFIHEKTVYIHCPVSYGNSKLNNNFFENKLKLVATTRNWKTLLKLKEIAAA